MLDGVGRGRVARQEALPQPRHVGARGREAGQIEPDARIALGQHARLVEALLRLIQVALVERGFALFEVLLRARVERAGRGLRGLAQPLEVRSPEDDGEHPAPKSITAATTHPPTRRRGGGGSTSDESRRGEPGAAATSSGCDGTSMVGGGRGDDNSSSAGAERLGARGGGRRLLSERTAGGSDAARAGGGAGGFGGVVGFGAEDGSGESRFAAGMDPEDGAPRPIWVVLKAAGTPRLGAVPGGGTAMPGGGRSVPDEVRCTSSWAGIEPRAGIEARAGTDARPAAGRTSLTVGASSNADARFSTSSAKNGSSSAIDARRLGGAPPRVSVSSRETSRAPIARCSSFSEVNTWTRPSSHATTQRSSPWLEPARRTRNWWPQLVHFTVVPRSLTSASSKSYSV